MCRKLFAISVVLLLAGSALAYDTNWTGTANDDWFNAGNWDTGVPAADDAVSIELAGTVDVMNNMTAVIGTLDAGYNSAVDVTINVQNALLSTSNSAYIHQGGAAGSNVVMNVKSGAQVDSFKNMLGGYNPSNWSVATLNVYSGGTYNINNNGFIYAGFGPKSVGIINQYGGLIEDTAARNQTYSGIRNEGFGRLNFLGGVAKFDYLYMGQGAGDVGRIIVDGGHHLEVSRFILGGGSDDVIMNIRDGDVYILGDRTGDVDNYALAGKLLGYGSNTNVWREYDAELDIGGVVGWTHVTPEPATVLLLGLGGLALIRRKR